ncbi:hypothetical protein PQG02_19795 [Nostoc sp. UHCC 0926]|nr:hypothetical protein [Nostoc sp. UHCC 0926]WDD30973.1 hypothetical protein PQG02_19795 [Nostoc sp. UHCC 0926]
MVQILEFCCNLRSLPAGGYAIATDFFRLGRLRFDFFFLSLP